MEIAEETFLFYFPPAECEAGVMPGYYWETHRENIPEMRANGGRDVSNDAGAWAEYERRLRAENESYL